MRFDHTILTNGLTIIGESRESAASVAIGFFVRTGARDEQPELSGVSHFLEHMVFKGTEKRSALDITYQLGAMGAQANAFTSEECTVFYAAVLPEYFADALELISDMLRPVLDEREFELEKKVILDEIALYQDKPSHLLFEAAFAEYFRDHGAGNRVLGTTESVSALTARQMTNYFDSRYTAPNIVLAAAGNFCWQELIELAERYTSHWASAPAPRQMRPHTPEDGSLVLTKDNLQQAHLCFVGPGPSATEKERYPLQVLSAILGASSGSRTYWEIVDKGLAEVACIDLDDMDGVGIVYGYLSTFPERLDEVGETLLRIMKTPAKFEDNALDRAKIKIATRAVVEGESSMRRLMAVGLDWLYRNEYATLDEELSRIRSVTRSDITQALEKYSFAPVTRVALLPAK